MAETPEEKETRLATATELLTKQVSTLTTVVQTNNRAITHLREEVNKKPDDEEVQFITGLASQERTKHLRYAIGTGVTSAIVAGVISFSWAHYLATEQIHERNRVGYSGCVSTNQRIHTIAEAFRSVVKGRPQSDTTDRIFASAKSIDATARPCDKLYPKDER